MTDSLDHIALNYNQVSDQANSGPITIGWMLMDTKAAIVYDPPERLVTGGNRGQHAKSATRCPAILNLETRYFVVKCPFDIHVGFDRDKNGAPILRNKAGPKSSIRANKLGEKLHLTSEVEWRFPDRPMLQLSLPYLFLADEPVYMTQVSAFAHYRKESLPGTIFGGRFPIHIWPRPLMWAFEWHEPQKDLILKRGEPLFYAQFEGNSPDRPFSLVEAGMNDELKDYLDKISGAVNYVNQTFSLFKAAEKVRPTKLIDPIKR